MAYFGKEPSLPNKPTVIESDGEKPESSVKKALKGPKYVPLLCETCSTELKPEMKFCPNGGAKVNH